MVVDKFILQLEAQLADRNVTIALTAKARKWLAVRGYDEAFGARPLGRLIQEHVKKPMADELLFGSLQKGGGVKIDIDKNDPDKLSFKFIADPEAQREGKVRTRSCRIGATEINAEGRLQRAALFVSLLSGRAVPHQIRPHASCRKPRVQNSAESQKTSAALSNACEKTVGSKNAKIKSCASPS